MASVSAKKHIFWEGFAAKWKGPGALGGPGGALGGPGGALGGPGGAGRPAGILTFFWFFQNVIKRALGALGGLGAPWEI